VHAGLDDDVAVRLQVDARAQRAGQADLMTVGDDEHVVLAVAAGEGHDIAAQAAVIGLQGLEGLGAAVARIDVDGHEPGLGQRDADASVGFALPPARDHVGVDRGVQHAARYESTQRALRAGLDRQDVPAQARVGLREGRGCAELDGSGQH
jgi:hypothetical protein